MLWGKRHSAFANRIEQDQTEHTFFPQCFKSLPNDKVLASIKLKAFTQNKFNVAEMMTSVSDREENNCGKRRKCWLPAFSRFPTMFSKAFFLHGRKNHASFGK